MTPGRQQWVARAVVALDDEEAAGPRHARLSALANQKRALDIKRAELATRAAGWETDRERPTDLAAWCQRMACNLPALTYQKKRDALVAIGVGFRV